MRLSFKLDYEAKTLIGKTLLGLEYGCNDGEGSRLVTLNQKIARAYVGMDESREDAGLWLLMENDEEVFVYSNEIVYYDGEKET